MDADLVRTDLADRLHDRTLQDLVAARHLCDLAVRQGAPDAVHTLREVLQGALAGLRHEVWLLRPRGGAGFGPAVAELAQRCAVQGPHPVTLQGELPTVTGDAAAAAYRVVADLVLRGPVTVLAHDDGRVDVTVALPEGEHHQTLRLGPRPDEATTARVRALRSPAEPT